MNRLANMVVVVLTAAVSPPVKAADWLQWGGPSGDFVMEAKGLAEKWPKSGPRQLWKRSLGDGYSAILFRDGKLFTMYSERDDEIVIALDATSGETIWEDRYPRKFWPDMSLQFGPGPNATPLIVGDKVISIGIDGQLRCLDITTGSLLWKHDLPAVYGRRKRVEEYGYSNSPLSYENIVIVHVGGNDHGVVALDPETGVTAWKSTPGGVSYAPATITKLAGRDQFIYFSPEGVNALDPRTGRLLWSSPIDFNNGNHLTPVVKCDDNHVWVASQFLSGGARLLKITAKGDALQAEQIWFDKRLRASHWTSVRVGDFIYGSTGGNSTSFLTAFNWKTGKTAWRKRGFHKAQALLVNGKLLFLDEDGELTLARISPEGMEVLCSAQLTESVSWTLPTLVATKLYLRDRKNIVAFALGK